MPVFYQENINDFTSLAIWKIEEPEAFFLQKVPLQREITHPHKRLQHLAGRYLLQYLYPEFPFDQLQIASTRQPFLPEAQFHFSISHCGDYAAALVSEDKRVGIDIEIPRSKIIDISSKFLNESERKHFKIENPSPLILHIQNNHDDYLNFPPFLPVVLWSAKEAVYKWYSYGGVDFKEQIHLNDFNFSEKGGIINAFFQQKQTRIPLQLHYRLFNEICLVWLMTDLETIVVSPGIEPGSRV